MLRAMLQIQEGKQSCQIGHRVLRRLLVRIVMK